MATSFQASQLAPIQNVSYNQGQLGAPVNANSLSTLADLTNIQKTQQDIQKNNATYKYDIANAKTDSEAKQFALKQKYQEASDKALTALSQDKNILEGTDPKAITNSLIQQRDRLIKMGLPQETVDQGVNHMIEIAHSNPAELKNFIGNIRRSGMGAESVQSNINQNQAVQGQDLSGNPTAIVRDPNTGALVQVPLNAQGAPQGGPQGMPQGGPQGMQQGMPQQNNMRIPAGETPETMKAFQDNRDVALAASQAAPQALTNIDTVLKYLPLASTGKYGESIAGLESVFGKLPGASDAEKAASARDIIQKSIADLGIQKNTALGGRFQADLAAAQNSLADAGKNPTAIVKSMQQLQPLIQHSQNYQKGLEATIAKKGIAASRQYNNEMVDAFDPQAMAVRNAYKSGDMKSFNDMTKGMSETRKRELFSKLKRYDKLTNEGY